jgi:hypothetical protein
MSSRISSGLGVIVLAACGGAPPAPATAPSAAAGPAVSLERLERIAMACAPDRSAADWVWMTATPLAADRWEVRVPRGADQAPPLVIEVAASTCDGAAVPTAPRADDHELDGVLASARACDGAGRQITAVGFRRDPASGRADRGRVVVSFAAEGSVIGGPQVMLAIANLTCEPVPVF